MTGVQTCALPIWQSPGYMGKVRSNSSFTEYNLFGIGENPERGLPPSMVRDQLCGVSFVFSISKNRKVHQGKDLGK